MNNLRKVWLQDIPLLIDVHCYNCKRLAALSNTKEKDERKYCFRCHEHLFGLTMDELVVR
jgi:hypothetical protein